MGHDPTIIYDQVETILRNVFLVQKEKNWSQFRHFKNPESFFEVFRADFVIDDKLQLNLMEINRSPSPRYEYINL
jgi:hypothetical protein